MNIPDWIDEALRQKNASEGEREIAGGSLFRVSEACLPCARPALFRAFGVGVREEFDARTLRRFEVGHTTAAWIEKQFRQLNILKATELPLVDKEWRIGGHVDFVVGGAGAILSEDGLSSRQAAGLGVPPATYEPAVTPVPLTGVELKSVHSASFWRYAKKNGGIVAQRHQLMQAGIYSLLADKQNILFDEQAIARWIVLSVSKDDLTMQEDPVTAKTLDQCFARIEELNLHYDSGTLPPCLCGKSEWQYKYCKYYPDQLLAGKARDGARCCPDSLLEKEAAVV